MNDLPRPLLPEGFTMPVIPTFSIDVCRVPSLNCGALSLSFTEPEAKPMNITDHIQRFCNAVVAGIRKFLQPLIDWFSSPQVRSFFRHLAATARKAGIVSVSKVPVRRRTVSTKRARLYQRKMQRKALTAL